MPNVSTSPSDPHGGRKNRRRSLPEPDFLTVRDVAALLSCSAKTVRRRIEAGHIKACFEGGRWLIDRRDYYDYTHRLRLGRNDGSTADKH